MNKPSIKSLAVRTRGFFAGEAVVLAASAEPAEDIEEETAMTGPGGARRRTTGESCGKRFGECALDGAVANGQRAYHDWNYDER